MTVMSILKKNSLEKKLRSCDGFTLIEVIIAVAILAITLCVLYGSQSQSLSLAAEAKFNTTAAFLIGSKLAELESGILETEDDEGDFGEDYPDFKWKIEVEDLTITDVEPLQEVEGLKHVIVTIYWEGSPFSQVLDYYHLGEN